MRVIQGLVACCPYVENDGKPSEMMQFYKPSLLYYDDGNAAATDKW